MKSCLRVLVGLLAVLVTVETASSQIEKGDKEFSVAASFMSVKYEHADDASTVFNIPVRVGFFVTRNVEAEPELLFSKFEGQEAGYILNGNLAYNFNRGRPGSEAVPFVLGGLGLSNTRLFLPNVAYSGAEDETWTVLNLGAGLKTFLRGPVALRWEYRFQKFSGDSDLTYHTVFLGVSVFIE